MIIDTLGEIRNKEMAKKPRKKRLHSSVSLILLSTTITKERNKRTVPVFQEVNHDN